LRQRNVDPYVDDLGRRFRITLTLDFTLCDFARFFNPVRSGLTNK
jgi:hypothetical protein